MMKHLGICLLHLLLLLQYEGCQEEGNDSGGNPIKNINEADTSP